jgi:hypothetical protein
MTAETPIATIRKNAREEIRVSLGEYQGRSVAHMRVWFEAGDGSMRPSRSGLAFRIDLLPEIAAAIVEARDTAESMGIIPATDR